MSKSSTESILTSLAANVRKYRQEAGLTQEKLADRLRMDVRYLQRIEKGEINISVVALIRFTNALGVSPGLLLEEADLPPPVPGRPPKRKE